MEAATVQNLVILEVNLISAQALPHVSNIRFLSSSNMETYMVAYLNPSQKLRSRTDKNGDVNPTWNDKFVFVLDEGLLTRSSSSCLISEIYCRRRFKKDKRIAEVHVLLENLIKNRPFRYDGEIRNYAAAFHVRDPYGEPHGVLNIGTATLNDIFPDQVPKFLSSNCAVDHRMLMASY